MSFKNKNRERKKNNECVINRIIRRTCTALTSLVSTMPLTYFPREGSKHSTQDSSTRCTSLSATRASIFRLPPPPLVCSRCSCALPGSERERAWEGGEWWRERAGCEEGRGSGWVQAGPPQCSAWRQLGGRHGGREGGRGAARAQAFHSRYDDVATCRHVTTELCVCRFPVFWSVRRSHDTPPRCARVPPSSETCIPRSSRCVCVCVCVVITDQ